MATTFLTKSMYLDGLRCPRRLWLGLNLPEVRTPLSGAQQHAIEQGNEVGRWARTLYPEGQLIDREAGNVLRQTRDAIAQGATCLFEAAFQAEDLFVQCDVLRRNEQGGWDILEVKASTSVKPEHIADLAIQRYVVEKAGLPLGSTCLLLVNSRDCYYPDLSNLLVVHDLSDAVKERMSALQEELSAARSVLARDTEPEVAVGSRCDQPYPCWFKEYCWQSVPEHSVFTLPHVDRQFADALAEQGAYDLLQLPRDYPWTPLQQTYVESVRSGRPQIDRAAIRSKLAELQYPVYFLDFETYSAAIPAFDGLKPYAQLPFQYSCHVLTADGALTHHDYLHLDLSDPRLPLLESLLRTVGDTGSVVAYYASFERTVLKQLAVQFPRFSSQVERIIARLWDQWEIFRYHYTDPAFLGSASIKKVLPVLVPGLSYEDLDVQKGDDAQAMWFQLITSQNQETREQLETGLRSYCRTDTLAMVELHRVLSAV